jgi:hypothetical protein
MNTLVRLFVVTAILAAGAVFAEEASAPSPVDPVKQVEVKVDPALLRGSIILHALPTRTGTYLGVTTAAVPPALRTQLDLPEGFGLLIEHIAPDSAAAKAGLQVHDVLYKLDDQVLVNSEQLATLVTARKPGDEVQLTVYRKGRPTTLAATLGEGPIKPLSGADSSDHWVQLRLIDMQRDSGEGVRAIAEWARRAAEVEGQKALLSKIVAEKVRAARSKEQGFTLSYTDDEHSLTVIGDEKGRKLVAKDKQDRTIFEGPVDTKEQIEKVPAELRGKLRKLESMTKLEVSSPASGLAWYYDVQAKEYFIDDTKRIAPFTRPNGHEAVRAHFFTCGDCEEGQRFIGYYEKYTPQVKAKLEQSSEPGQLYEMAFQGRLYSRDGQTWVPADRPEGIRITAELQQRCPPKKLRYCPPKDIDERHEPRREER